MVSTERIGRERRGRRIRIPNRRRLRAAHARDDDGLLRDLRKAANDKIAPSCVNVRSIRPLIAKGFDREKDVITVFREAVSKLKSPLRTFDAPWLVEEITAWSEARKSATGDGASSAGRARSTFIASNDPRWADAAGRYHRERRPRIGPPAVSTGPHGANGWWFPVDWPECAPAAAASLEAAQ
jgi:hypothetical protein